MNLIHEHYMSLDPARAVELATVRERNAASGIFTTILPVADGGRKTFAELFDLAARRFPGEICVVANSDIAFDASLAGTEDLIRRHPRPLLVALSRWDDPSGPSMEGRIDPATWRFYSHSQDTWVFRAGSLPDFAAQFTLGIPACESRLAYEAVQAGVAVVNPALSVRTWHHHGSAVRSWRLKDSYRGPLFFPRLTTLDVAPVEGYAPNRSRWRTRRGVVRA
jgi:hypothetical protein